MYLEQIQPYKYLGSTVSSDNLIEEEIQNRITLGNKAYYANQFLFKSRFVSKKLKMRLYWNIIRPKVTYGCETWVLKETVKTKLTLNLPKTTIVAQQFNIIKWQLKFNPVA